MKRLIIAVLSVVPLLGIAGYAAASSDRSAASATAAFHDLEKARDAGYVVQVAELSGATCIAHGAEGAMGDHFVNQDLLLDQGVIDATAPEAVVYEQRNNGTYKLVALEYIVFKADWEAAGNTGKPSLFGPGVRLHRRAEPVRAATVLFAPRVDLETEPEWTAHALESGRQLFVDPEPGESRPLPRLAYSSPSTRAPRSAGRVPTDGCNEARKNSRPSRKEPNLLPPVTTPCRS